VEAQTVETQGVETQSVETQGVETQSVETQSEETHSVDRGLGEEIDPAVLELAISLSLESSSVTQP
jgi:hypothetical protein